MGTKKHGSKPKAKSGVRGLIMRIFMTVFLVYSVVMLMDMQVSLAQRKQERDELERQMEALRLDQKELQRQYAEGLDGDEIERIAREKLDYVKENEKVFVNNSGK